MLKAILLLAVALGVYWYIIKPRLDGSATFRTSNPE